MKASRWVRDLRVANGARIEPACSAATVDEYVRHLGPAPVEWAVHTAHSLVTRVVELMPEFDSGPARSVTLRVGMEAATLGVLKSIDAGRVVDSPRTPEAERAAEEFVRWRIPLTSVWASVRHGHAWLSDLLMRACINLVPADEQAEALRLLNEVAFEFVNQLTEGLAETYNAENERWLATALAMREEAVRNLLRGGDLDLAKASECLRYEVENRHHLALVAWPESHGAADANALQQVAGAWLTAAGAQQTLLVPQGTALLWAWGNRRTAFSTELVTELAPQVRISTGLPGHDARGFRQSHVEAVEAHRVVRLAPDIGKPVVGFAEVELLSLLTANRDATARFVARELGELANDDPHIADLRATVRTYLESHSPQATATRMFVARNTVIYRLKRAEELLGRSLTTRQLELCVALTLAASLREH